MNGDEAIYARAARLIEQAFECTDEDLYDSLTRQAYDLLAPLVARGVPEAQYLHSGSTLNLEGLDDQAFAKRRVELIKKAAEAGHARAQFTLGQMYEPDNELPADARPPRTGSKSRRCKAIQTRSGCTEPIC